MHEILESVRCVVMKSNCDGTTKIKLLFSDQHELDVYFPHKLFETIPPYGTQLLYQIKVDEHGNHYESFAPDPTPVTPDPELLKMLEDLEKHVDENIIV